MLGDGAVRSCSRCEREVFDLSQMTLGQAEALLAARASGGMCVRVYRRRDGTMMFADCVVGARGVLKRRLAVAGAAAIAAVAAARGADDNAAPSTMTPTSVASDELRALGDAFLSGGYSVEMGEPMRLTPRDRPSAIYEVPITFGMR